MAKTSRFTPEQIEEVHRALATAEELTGGFYCIPGREWPRYPYDVTTRADGPVPDAPAFADVVRVVATEKPAGNRSFRERYRIRLSDETVLGAVHGGEEGVDLAPLLLYVLTHELVHVIRFGGGSAEFEAGLEDRLREERRVHGITWKILAPTTDPGLQRVADLYSEAYLEASGPGVFSPK